MSKAERADWGNFPAVIRNGDLGTLKNEPEYEAAKQGNRLAALDLIERVLTDAMIAEINTRIGTEKSYLLPVLAQEQSGRNMIPLMMAEVLGDRMGLAVETDIVQTERIYRTNSDSNHRLAFNPTFTGPVKAGQSYVILDDTLTMGGTLASLRGYVENRGGRVIAAAVMTAHIGALELPVTAKTLAAIHQKHGPAMDLFWKEEFSYGIEQLTKGEAGHLRSAVSVDLIRDRIAKARNERSLRLGEGGTSSPPAGQASQYPVESSSSLSSPPSPDANAAVRAFDDHVISRQVKAFGYRDGEKRWEGLPESLREQIEAVARLSPDEKKHHLDGLRQTLTRDPHALAGLQEALAQGRSAGQGRHR